MRNIRLSKKNDHYGRVVDLRKRREYREELHESMRHFRAVYVHRMFVLKLYEKHTANYPNWNTLTQGAINTDMGPYIWTDTTDSTVTSGWTRISLGDNDGDSFVTAVPQQTLAPGTTVTIGNSNFVVDMDGGVVPVASSDP